MSLQYAISFIGLGVGRLISYPSLALPILSLYDSYGDARYAVYRLESICAFIAFVIAIYFLRRHIKSKRRTSGDIWRLAIAMYSAFQIVLESMHDEGFMHFGFVLVSQAISMLLMMILGVYFVIRMRKAHVLKAHYLWMLPFTFGGCALTIYQEFRVDASLHPEKEHLIMLGGVIIMLIPVLYAVSAMLPRKKPYKKRRHS